MPLEYPHEWKFSGLGFALPAAFVNDVVGVMEKVASGDSYRKHAIEKFKNWFGKSCSSTNYSYAVSDLREGMLEVATNPADFLDQLWSALAEARESNLKTPAARVINELLVKHGVPLRIDGDQLEHLAPDAVIATGDAAVEGAFVHYKRGTRLGGGASGDVYEVTRRNAVATFTYALKEFNPTSYSDDPVKDRQRFGREIEVLISLQHRAIISYVDAGISLEGKPFLVMPMIHGKNIREALSGCDVLLIIDAFVEITDGLSYAHANGIVHRDLKPSNVWMRETDRQPIILDFGAAYLADEKALTITTKQVGTNGYIAPEVEENAKSRLPAQDIFSVGVMLYECSARQRPKAHSYRRLGDIQPDFDVLDALVLQAIEEDPAKRPTAVEFRDLLRAAREAAAIRARK